MYRFFLFFSTFIFIFWYFILDEQLVVDYAMGEVQYSLNDEKPKNVNSSVMPVHSSEIKSIKNRDLERELLNNFEKIKILSMLCLNNIQGDLRAIHNLQSECDLLKNKYLYLNEMTLLYFNKPELAYDIADYYLPGTSDHTSWIIRSLVFDDRNVEYIVNNIGVMSLSASQLNFLCYFFEFSNMYPEQCLELPSTEGNEMARLMAKDFLISDVQSRLLIIEHVVAGDG